MNSDKMVKNDTQHQKRGEESNNTGLGKIENKNSNQKEE
jgi:hypothetical protein